MSNLEVLRNSWIQDIVVGRFTLLLLFVLLDTFMEGTPCSAVFETA
jgi:hypothetical protein